MLIKLIRLTANLFSKSVTDKLLKLNSMLRPEHRLHILRLYGRTHERQDYPDPIYKLKLHAEDEVEGMCQKEFKGDALHHIIRNDDTNEIKQTDENFHESLKDDIIPSAVERKRLSSF